LLLWVNLADGLGRGTINAKMPTGFNRYRAKMRRYCHGCTTIAFSYEPSTKDAKYAAMRRNAATSLGELAGVVPFL
jgi:hypothetical protein